MIAVNLKVFWEISNYDNQGGQILKKLAIITAAAALVTAFGAQTVQAGHLACGQVLVANAIFDSDLDCSGLTGSAPVPVDGLTIAADNVTINLKGFSLIGPASFGAVGGGACPAGFGGTTNRTIGIRVDGFDNTNILNGTITGFEFGIMVKNAAGVSIKDIEADNNAFNA